MFCHIVSGSFEHFLVEAYPSLSCPEPPPAPGPDVAEEEQLKENIADAMSEAAGPAVPSSHHHHHSGLARHHRGEPPILGGFI